MAYSSQQLEKPCHFLLGLGILTVYIPGIFGAAISTGWLFLFVAIPIVLLFYKDDFALKDAHILGIIFIFLAALSFLWVENFNIAWFFFLQLVICITTLYLGSCIKDIKYILHGLGAGIAVNSIISVLQYKGQLQIIFTNANEIAALFVNKNIYCEVSAVLFIIFAVYKLWYWIPFTLPAFVIVHSRAAMLALGIYITYEIYKRSKLIAGVIVLLGVAFLFYSDHASLHERFSIWKDTVSGLSILGNGVGSFDILYPKNAVNIDTLLARPKQAHNDLLQIIFEHGIFSSILIAMFINVLSIKSEKQIILWAIIVISLFTYPFHIPAMAFIWFIIAGNLISSNGSDGVMRYIRGSNLFKSFKGKQRSLSQFS